MSAKMAGQAAFSGVSSRLAGVLIVIAGLALGGCSDVDSMLFGDSGPDTDTTTSESTGTASSQATLPAATTPLGSSLAPVATITPVTVEPGSDTGTAVSKTVAGLRAQLSTIEANLAQNAQRLADLRNSGAEGAAAYHESKARITTRLQIGTTRGNPELVSEWNRAQSSLDQLSGNINGLNALGTAIGTDASSAHYALDQIGATFNVSGAVDEDHRQLSVLQDETNQTIVLIDKLLTEVSADVQRQTAYVANERANLTTLASAIKAGELYGADFNSPLLASAAAAPSGGSYSGTPLVVIRFDRANVDYQQILYAALQQALKTRPGAGFAIIAVSPTRGNAAAVQLAQTSSRRHADEVMRSMTDMGVPVARMSVASSTDPSATASEVRVFVR
jgi:hypothetical protein